MLHCSQRVGGGVQQACNSSVVAPVHQPLRTKQRRTPVRRASSRRPEPACPQAACDMPPTGQQQQQPCRSSRGEGRVVAAAPTPAAGVDSSSMQLQPQHQQSAAAGRLQVQPQHPPLQHHQGKQRHHLQPQWQPQLQLLSEDSGGSKQQQQPEPHSASGAPQQQAAAGGGSSSSDSTSTSKPAPAAAAVDKSSTTGSSSSSSSSSENSSSSLEDDVDEALNKLWANIKKDLKKELPPDQASMLDSWSPTDIQTDKVFREMATHQLGPFLQSMGIEQDPYDFFLDLFRLALLFQLAAAGLVFYTTELGLGGNVGDAFRAVGGLLLGYSLRLGIKVEQLAWPVYNGLVQLLISEGATYEIPPASAEEQRDTLNRLGVALAASFLLPKFAFGWQNDECWQIVVPMLGGLFFFDVAYMFALLIKLNMGGGGGDDRE